MIQPTTSTKIFSILGNEKSLITLGVKDIGTIAGMTAGSYIAGKAVEGKDRFIDEVGTSIIWLCGIPIFKGIIDKTVYKLAKLNPNIDVRLLENPKLFQKAKEHAPDILKQSFEKVGKNAGLFKKLFYAKFFASTVLTLGAYFGLTMFRQKHTEKAIMKEIKEEEKQKKLQKKQAEAQKTKDPSFGLNMNFVKQFVFDPVKNTQIIDGGITTQRLAESRNIQDFISYSIREGGFLVAMYVVSKQIQQHMEKKAAASHKPIDLDIRILQDEKFKKAFASGEIKKHLDDLQLKGTDIEIYESLFNKGENIVVQMAKKAEIIKTFENDSIDTQSFIDIKEVKGLREKVANLYKEAAVNSKKGTDAFFNEVIKLKKASIVKGIGASIGILGVVIPGFILLSRFMKDDNKEFRVKTEMKERMKKEKNLVA